MRTALPILLLALVASTSASRAAAPVAKAPKPAQAAVADPKAKPDRPGGDAPKPSRPLTLRKLGATGAAIGVPESWTLRFNGGGAFLADERGNDHVVVHPDATVGGRFDRLPRAGSPELARGAKVTEKVLETGARYYRRVEPSGEIAIFVDLALGDGRSMLAAAFADCEDICLTLQRAPVRFQAADGTPLTGFDAAWEALHGFYGEATPATFEVDERPPGGPAQFNTARLRLLIPRDTLQERGAPTLVHEGSHVCLSRLTKGASELEALRFVDEGLATIFEHRLAGTLPLLERSAREAAALQLAAGNLSFEKLAKWTVYFGTPGSRTAYAYPVGAAFDLYVRSTFGEERFKSFLIELGRARELDAASREALGRSAEQLEAAWIASLQAVKVEKPAIVKRQPEQGATKVPVGTRELRVTLNADMAATVCVRAECGASNVCYSGASWASARELVIVPDGPLLPKHRYKIDLGIEGHCLMATLNGQSLAASSWEFETE